MKIYVCYGTWTKGPRPHPCGLATQALREAGYDPEVKKVYGLGPLPEFMNPGRKPVRELTGQQWVPAVELDDGTGISGSEKIIAWAKEHPAGG